MKRNTEQASFSMLSNALTRKGVNVTIAGGSSYTNGKRIVIGVGPWDQMVCSLLHESAHLNHTNFSAIGNVMQQTSTALKNAINVLEDIRIDLRNIREFPGAIQSYQSSRRILVDIITKREFTNCLDDILYYVLLVGNLENGITAIKPALAGFDWVTLELDKLCLKYAQLAQTAKDTLEVRELAENLLLELAAMQLANQQEAEGEAEAEAEGDAEGKSNGNTSGKALSNSKGFNEIDLEQSFEDLDIGKLLEAHRYQQDMSNYSRVPEPIKVVPYTVQELLRGNPSNVFPAANLQVNGAVANAVKVMFRQRNMKLSGVTQFGELDEDRLVDAFLGNPGAKNIRRDIAANLSVGVLLDASGSMGYPWDDTHRSYVATKAAMAMTQALEKQSGVLTSLSLFGDFYLELKGFALKKTPSVLPYVELGGTSTGSAMMEMGSKLILQSSQKKVMFVITDGQPDVPQEVVGSLDWLAQHSVVVLPVIIGQVDVRFTGFKDLKVACIDHVNELPKQLMQLLKQHI
ncbi:hypothetical protein ACN2AK_21975 [Shewanella xiamenensis]|uniref:hypothetical protein n=1 Tax=Shewanella sp. Shew256 TaxID=1969376 RepID=UPI0020CDC6BB|nr:hypothetical protein [Shewanella sp. Shew256]